MRLPKPTQDLIRHIDDRLRAGMDPHEAIRYVASEAHRISHLSIRARLLRVPDIADRLGISEVEVYNRLRIAGIHSVFPGSGVYLADDLPALAVRQLDGGKEASYIPARIRKAVRGVASKASRHIYLERPEVRFSDWDNKPKRFIVVVTREQAANLTASLDGYWPDEQALIRGLIVAYTERKRG